nr:reverse transcriptase domain-containing protein [Tanacetum cinerariifolium]
MYNLHLMMLCLLDGGEKVALRSSSPTTSISEILNAPILPAQSTIVAPSSEFPLAPIVAHLGFFDDEIFLSDPRRTFLLRLALRYTSHHLDHFTFGSSSSHSSSWHSSFGHSLSEHTPPDTTIANSSTPSRFVHPSIARTSWCSEAYLCWRSASLSTMYPLTTSESSAGDSSFESYAGPSRKRCEDSVEEDIDTNVLEDIEANAIAVEVTIDRDVEAGIDAGIDMEVDVGIDVEDEVEDKFKPNDRGTIEVGLDVVTEIDIPDGMLMPDAVEHLEQVEDGLQDIYEHVMAENKSQNSNDNDNGNGGDGNGRNGNLNKDNRDARLVARECTYQDFMKCQPLNFKGTKGVNLTMKNDDLAAYTQKFQELNMMCTKMVPEEEDRVKKFIGGTDRSFVSTNFSTSLDVTPDTLDVSYAVELANGRISKTNTILRHCTLGLLGHPFSIDLMPVELGSFNVIIDMD